MITECNLDHNKQNQTTQLAHLSPLEIVLCLPVGFASCGSLQTHFARVYGHILDWVPPSPQYIIVYKELS